MRKFFAAIIVIILSLSCISFGAFAVEHDYTFYGSDAVIDYTDEVTVNISVKNNKGFASYKLAIGYDTQYLELISAAKAKTENGKYNRGSVVINKSLSGEIYAVFASTEDVVGDIDLLTLEFKAIGFPSGNGNTPITVDVVHLDDAIWNDENLTADAVSKNGNVCVRALTDLAIENSGETEYIEDQHLDTSKLDIIAKYNNGDKKILDSSEFEIIDYSTPLQLGEVPKVKYVENSIEIIKELPVTIREKKLVSIRLENFPEKTVYKTYETFSTDGMRVTGLYDNGNEYELTDYTVYGFDTTVGDKKVYVKKSGISSGAIDVKVVLPGDVTCDGSVQPNDAVAILQHAVLLGTLEAHALLAGDVVGNGDGVNLNDAIAILRYCAGYGIELK